MKKRIYGRKKLEIKREQERKKKEIIQNYKKE